MSNFQCPHCGMTNIDCDKDGFKTPREIELESRVKELEEKLKIAEKFLIEMVKGEKLFTDKDYLFRAKLALQKMEEVKK